MSIDKILVTQNGLKDDIIYRRKDEKNDGKFVAK